MTELSDDDDRTILAWLFLPQYQHVTDKWKDGQTLLYCYKALVKLQLSSSLVVNSSVECCLTEHSTPNDPISCLPPSRKDPSQVVLGRPTASSNWQVVWVQPEIARVKAAAL